MITKEEALKRIRIKYSNDHYVTGMTKWDKYYIFHLLAKDPEHKMQINQPFSVLVNEKGEIGTANLAEEARQNGNYDEYVKACREGYEELEKVPDEANWFFNDLIKKYKNKK